MAHAIPWDDVPRSLDAGRRRLLGAAWRWRMEQEHLAVGAFAKVALELAAVGCEPAVLSLVTRAASDEVRHADLCRRLAEVHLGEALPSRLSGVPRLPDTGDRSPEDAALLHVVEMCCLSETFTGVYLTEMLERATHPLAHAVVQSLVRDEIDHGRAGWAYLAAVRARGEAARLGDDLPALLAATIQPVIDEAREAPEGDDAEIEAHGYVVRDRGAALYERALRDVVLPGFEAVGVDTGPARAYARAHGWLGGASSPA
jgi:hypothetical protein